MTASVFRSAAVGLTLVLCGCSGSMRPAAFSPSRAEARLVEFMVQRLELACQVAWNKFQNNGPVKDPKRETELLASLELQARRIGLSEEVGREFFEAQIAASRQVQEKLISAWKRGTSLPAVPPRDLRRDIRPRLDAIGEQLLRDLAEVKKSAPHPGLAGFAEKTILARGFSSSVAGTAAAPLR